jgi:hypothetical protein
MATWLEQAGPPGIEARRPGVVMLLFRQEINCRPPSSEFRSRLDLKASIVQPLNDDICRVCRVKEDFRRKIAGAEQVDEHVLRGEIAGS